MILGSATDRELRFVLQKQPRYPSLKICSADFSAKPLISLMATLDSAQVGLMRRWGAEGSEPFAGVCIRAGQPSTRGGTISAAGTFCRKVFCKVASFSSVMSFINEYKAKALDLREKGTPRLSRRHAADPARAQSEFLHGAARAVRITLLVPLRAGDRSLLVSVSRD
jgi:hypothetical protein